MNISRRFFLGGVIAVAAGQLIHPVFAMPTIYGNGLDDDTDGLNAFFGGRPFHVDHSNVIVGEGGISFGRFKVSDTIILSGRNKSITDCTFLGGGRLVEPTNAKIPSLFSCDLMVENLLIARCTFDCSARNATTGY